MAVHQDASMLDVLRDEGRGEGPMCTQIHLGLVIDVDHQTMEPGPLMIQPLSPPCILHQVGSHLVLGSCILQRVVVRECRPTTSECYYLRLITLFRLRRSVHISRLARTYRYQKWVAVHLLWNKLKLRRRSLARHLLLPRAEETMPRR